MELRIGPDKGRIMIQIGKHIITEDGLPFFIAEIGHNHMGDIEVCMDLIRMAKASGASAIKLQKRYPKEIMTRALYNMPYASEAAYGETYGLHREALEFSDLEWLELKEFADNEDIPLFGTCFCKRSADFLHEINTPAFKISSFDVFNLPLIKYVAQFGKPLIISTGGADILHIQRVFDEISPINPEIILLHCVSEYPTRAERLNLKFIEELQFMLPATVIGLSDHYPGILSTMTAYMLGARVFEKHFTGNRAWKGTDHSFSLEPKKFAEMVRDIEVVRQSLGTGRKEDLTEELKNSYRQRKGLYAARAMTKGEIITPETIRILSPGDGFPPYKIDKLIGKPVKRDVGEEEIITREIAST